MILYKDIPQFDQTTGKPTTALKLPSAVVCDYCARIIEFGSEDDEFVSPVIIELHDSGDYEPWYSEDKCMINGEKVDLYELHSNQRTFNYCVDWSGCSCESDLMTEWSSNILPPNLTDKFEKSNINGFQFCHIMSAARYRVITYLCEKDEKYIEGLNLHFK